jgi:uncharacterized protein with HEPN domain
MSRDWTLFLRDILTACEKVPRYTAGMPREAFFADDRTYDAVVRNLEIIGAASKQVPESVPQSLSQIEWPKIGRMRNVQAQVYFGVDPDVLWNVVQHKVPELSRAVAEFLQRPPPRGHQNHRRHNRTTPTGRIPNKKQNLP